MARVLTCIDYDDSTHQCVTQAWVEQASIADMLPTHQQANAVGFAFFGTLFLVAAAIRTFKPPKH